MASATALLQEIQLRLGEVRNDVGTGVATQLATAVGSPGSSLLGSPDSHVHPFAIASGGIIQPVSPSTSSGGESLYFSRGDHIHFFNFAGHYGNYASNVSLSTSTGGADSSVSRVDHVHYLVPGTTAEVKTAGAANDGGTQSHVARIDHVHAFSQTTGLVNYAATATLCNVSWTAGEAGTLTDLARGDHVHRILPGTRNVVTGSRTKGTTYTNNGTGPMFVGISMAFSAVAALGAHFQVGGTDIAHVDAPADTHQFLLGIVNANEQYLLTCSVNVHIEHWYEYGF